MDYEGLVSGHYMHVTLPELISFCCSIFPCGALKPIDLLSHASRSHATLNHNAAYKTAEMEEVLMFLSSCRLITHLGSLRRVS
jgi:hypothetical protein